MFVIKQFQTPPAEILNSQILQLVVDNLTDISAIAIPASNPLYSLYQYAIGFEVHRYLEALDPSKGIPVQLLVALDEADGESVLGFLLYQPRTQAEDACAVTYLAVRADRRRRGIARALLAQMAVQYPHVELKCSVAKVTWFEALGFQVLAASGTQVLMNSRSQVSDGLLALLDTAPIYRSLEVQQIHSYLLKQHGRRAMLDAEKQRDRHLDQLTRQARLFVEARSIGQVH
jgi:GNAT superfamily N-acetyltransferase